jgi:predicted Mrr-cat superfamily restriction endonuclease
MSEDINQEPESAAWLVRGGEKGEREELALASGLVIAGWKELGDISGRSTPGHDEQISA